VSDVYVRDDIRCWNVNACVCLSGIRTDDFDVGSCIGVVYWLKVRPYLRLNDVSRLEVWPAYLRVVVVQQACGARASKDNCNQ